MNDVLICVVLTIFGAMLGSFAGAQVWRIRARQLVEDKKAGEPVDTTEYKRLLPLTKQKLLDDHSVDLDTGTTLRWYDMIPIVSWLLLCGKSRYSGKPIGWMELLIEVGMAAFFVISYLMWPAALDTPLDITVFVLWLVAGVGFGILFAYDAKWFLLPDIIMLPAIGFALVSATISILSAVEPLSVLVSTLGAVAIMSGLYALLYLYSRWRYGIDGAWIGLGDVKLGIALGLLLGQWELALLALFLANLIGTLLVLPGMVRGRINRRTHIPFGPLLILGMIIAKLVGIVIINWYLTIFLA